MWEEIKEFSFPFSLTIGLVSLFVISVISVSYGFDFTFLLLINFPFLLGWFYFLLGFYVKIKFREKNEAEKRIRIIGIMAPAILVLFTSCVSLIGNSTLTSRFTNYFYFSLIITLSFSILFIYSIKLQWNTNKKNLLVTSLIIVGILLLGYSPSYALSDLLKMVFLLVGFFCLITASLIRIRLILSGDELEKQIHLETLAYVFPFSMIFLFFLFVVNRQFNLTISERLVGYLPFAIVIFNSLAAKLIRNKYS